MCIDLNNDQIEMISSFVTAYIYHFKKIFYFLRFILMFLNLCVCYVHGCPQGDLLELQLQAVVTNPLWVLGTKLESPGAASKSLNH